MSIDEQELRRRLVETAAQAGAPRFTAGELARQVRRRRARVITGFSGAVMAVAAVAVAVPVALSGSSQPAIGRPAPPPPELSYVVTVNGQTQRHPAGALTLPRYVIAPREDLTITVEVTVPAHVTLTGLWLGITNGMLTSRPDGSPDMSPILAARTRAPLGPGVYQFRLHWAVPAGLRPGTSRQLSVQWAWPDGLAERYIVMLDVQRRSGAASSLIPAHGPEGSPPGTRGRLCPDLRSGRWRDRRSPSGSARLVHGRAAVPGRRSVRGIFTIRRSSG